MNRIRALKFIRPTVTGPMLLVLLLLVGACRDTAHLPALGDEAVILAFGDSLTYGTGVGDGSDYPAILSELTARTVINEGVPGEISQTGVQRLPGLLDAHGPDLLVLIHGGNDMLRGIPETRTHANLKAMIEQAQAREIAVVMLGVPKPGLLLLNSADFYETAAAESGVPIDLAVLPDVLADRGLKSDPIHPNEAGYRRMAEALYRLLQEGGAL